MGAISQAVVALEGVTVPVVPVQRAAGECQRREHPGPPRFGNKTVTWRIVHPNQLPTLAVESLSSGSDQTNTRSRGWRNGGRGWGLSSPSGLGQRLGGTSRATNVTSYWEGPARRALHIGRDGLTTWAASAHPWTTRSRRAGGTPMIRRATTCLRATGRAAGTSAGGRSRRTAASNRAQRGRGSSIPTLWRTTTSVRGDRERARERQSDPRTRDGVCRAECVLRVQVGPASTTTLLARGISPRRRR